MKKKILLFATDPGGANTLIPLVEPLKKRGYIVSVFGKGTALVKFQQNAIPAINIMKIIHRVGIGNITKFLKNEKPNFIITGTSANDMTKKYIWKASENMRIPSFAILDQWMNYGIRFSRYGTSEIEKYENYRDHEFMPTKILVMDKLAKKEMVKEGIPKNKILITGQPYFEFIQKKKIDSTNLKKLFEIKESDFVVTFASEPIIKTYHETIKSKHYFGYNEISIFKHLYQILLKISKLTTKKIKIVIKLHPKENEIYYSQLIPKLDQDKITILVNKCCDTQELIKISNLVCGMSSMFLLESHILKKPTISIQIGLKKENPFVLDRIGVIKSCSNEEQLFRKIENIILNNQQKTNNKFNLVKNPVKNIIKYMVKYLKLSATTTVKK